MNRREFIRRMVVASTLAVTGVAAIVELLARTGSPEQAYQLPAPQAQSSSGSSTGTSSGTTSVARTQQPSAPPGYFYIGNSSTLSGRSSAYFAHPTYGNSILVNTSGKWKAFSATCTHAPCTVQYSGGSSIYCPCHGATFSTGNGGVLGGPAPVALPEFGVQVDASGNLFVTTAAIN